MSFDSCELSKSYARYVDYDHATHDDARLTLFAGSRQIHVACK
jgi:hypothetical protein